MLFNLVLDIKVAINSHYLSFGELAPETENKQIHRYFKKIYLERRKRARRKACLDSFNFSKDRPSKQDTLLIVRLHSNQMSKILNFINHR